MGIRSAWRNAWAQSTESEDVTATAIGCVQAVVETLTAEIKVKQPRELADYAKAFAGLAEMAVYGDAARARIRAAIDALE